MDRRQTRPEVSAGALTEYPRPENYFQGERHVNMANSSNPVKGYTNSAANSAILPTSLNFRQDGISPVPTTRKPFDVLIEGLYSEQSRGDRI